MMDDKKINNELFNLIVREVVCKECKKYNVKKMSKEERNKYLCGVVDIFFKKAYRDISKYIYQ